MSLLAGIPHWDGEHWRCICRIVDPEGQRHPDHHKRCKCCGVVRPLHQAKKDVSREPDPSQTKED